MAYLVLDSLSYPVRNNGPALYENSQAIKSIYFQEYGPSKAFQSTSG